MSYPLTQSTGGIICGAGRVKRLIHYIKKFFGLIVLDLCINVHSCFAVFMSGKVLNRLGVNACIKQICNIGMPKLMGRHFKIQGIDNPGVVFLAGSQRRLYRVFDALSVHIFIIGALLCGTDNNVLPHSLEL